MCVFLEWYIFVCSIVHLYRIDRKGVIKVADFGLTEDMYGTNYFRRRTSVTGSEEKVPIRWMAPESIKHDIYNEETDVVCIMNAVFVCYDYFNLCCHVAVGIWCDSVGNIYLWKNSVSWNSCYESTEGIREWTEAGKT